MATLLWGLLGLGSPAHAVISDPAQGPGGPILVLTNGNSNFGKYYAEILRAEGMNSFAVADVSTVSAASLAAYDVVLLAKTTLTAAQATTLTTWVNGGGNLIAMAPDAQLNGLLGLTSAGTALANGYLLVNTATNPGAGIVDQTIQYHGDANRYTLNGATAIATLYSNATTATTSPAVTLRSVGSGKAAAFAYDLATSVVYTRQGNPAWATQERDGSTPIRSNDKFYGNATGDPQPDWIDLNKVAIPQADEQQRLLANLILFMNQSKKPLPRFWYFPNGKKAAVIMTGDDHAVGGTAARFEEFKAASPVNCSVADWECIRGTSYIYSNTPLTNAQAAQYNADGFEISLHINTGCADFTASSLATFYSQQVPDWTSKYTSIPAPVTQRHHCLVWSDWASGAEVQRANGMRMDTSYYVWPPSWINNVPGLLTGSAMPMRFARLDGTLIDSFMAATQMTDESGQTYPFTIDSLLDRAVGAQGYFGAYTVNAHTDRDRAVSDAVVASAQSRGVPVVSARQMLNWLDGRDASSFSAMSWNGSALSFTVNRDTAATGLQAMLPLRWGSSVVSTITRAGSPVSFTISTIKGVEYAMFAAQAGAHVATYGSDVTAPQVSSVTPAAGAGNVAVTVQPAIVFSEPMDPATLNANTIELRNAANVVLSTTLSYDAGSRTLRLVPAAALAASTTYTVTVRGGTTDPRVKDAAGNAMAASFSSAFTTAAPAGACPCSGWPATATPSNASANDATPIELGVKFRSNVNGYVTGIRFYKGANNTGTHIGNLWTAAGALLASATFTSETAGGWQQVTFATPVAITANTVYVASYYAPVGGYAFDNDYFAVNAVTNGPITLLREGDSGGNGVFTAAAASSFPASSFRSTNYWVDVVFDTAAAPDTTPPTVASRTPASGATAVPLNSAVSASFSEALDAATVNANTVELRVASNNALVPGAVSYSAATNTATFTPSAALAASTTYTATFKGGSTDPRIKDAVGNALAANATWSFTTAAPVVCPCSAWPNTATPATASASDTTPIELGVKFRVDASGFITGIRFYKGAANTGTHVGNLWSVGGSLLATATFTNESATGWQQVNFTTPVAVTANTVYVASYYAPAGGYAFNNDFFATSGLTNGPITLLREGDSGGNGVFTAGASSSFPASSFRSTNYWVDVVFNTTAGGDTTPPTVTATSPAAGATGVSRTAPVTVTFSEAMDASTINGTNVSLRDAANALVPATVTYTAATNTATLTPSATLAGSTLFTATVGVGVKDVAGNALATARVWSFTTAAVPDTTPPTITATVPSAGATGVSRTAPVTVTFSEPMDAATITAANLTLRDAANAAVPATVSYTSATNTATLAPSATLAGSTLFTATVGTAVRDATGNALVAPASWSFTTAAVPDTTPPTVTATVPAAGATGVSRTAPITVTFSEPMNAATVTATSITLTGAGGAVAATVSYTAATNTATLTPNAALAGVTLFTATVTTAVRDVAGNAPASATSWTFTTAAVPDTTPPTATSSSPASGATGVSRSTAITVTFSEAMDAATVNTNTLELRDATGALVPVTVSYNAATFVATLTPSAILAASTVHTIIAKGGATDPRLKDLAGNALAANQSASFTTAAPSGTNQAQGKSTSQSSTDFSGASSRAVDGNTDGVYNNGSISHTGFENQPWWQVDLGGTVAIDTIELWNRTDCCADRLANFVVFASSASMTGRTLAQLQADTTVRKWSVAALGSATKISLSALSGQARYVRVQLAGQNYLSLAEVRVFGVVIDSTAPTVTSVSPSSGAILVSRGSSVTATFSEAMDAATLNGTTVQLRSSGGSSISATVSYNATTRVVTLNPTSNLSPLTTYTVTIRGGSTDPRVKDVAGNALVSNRTWSFTTGLL
jgi:hypothetical protein